MMISTGAAAVTAVFGLLLGTAHADKDDSYYIAGTGNPNRDEKMYWKDAENIFQDLSQFQTLYVEFHNCAWTWMMMNDEDNDIDENDYWYMGKIPPMGANVAYSLYGSLYGESFDGCGENTFINSFYTNSGFTNFARAMNYAGLSGFSSYSYDDDYSSSYTATCGGGYGVGCDYSNGFAVHTYSGETCDPANYTGVSDKMSDFNSAIKAATCVQIYDADSYSGNPYGTPLELLAYSHSCFYQDFFSPDGVCPDPYGKLSYYQKQFYNGIQESKKQDPYQVSQRKEQYHKEIRNGKIMSLLGLGLAALAFVIFFYECLRVCCGFEKKKEVMTAAYTCRENDFIIKSRDEADEDNNQTVGDKSEMSSRTGSEMYVTMSMPVEGTPYTPPAEVGLVTAASEPTPQGAGAATPALPPPKEPEIVTPPPEAALPPPPPVVIAPEPALPPQTVTPTSPLEEVPGADTAPETNPPPEAVVQSPETVNLPTSDEHPEPEISEPGAPITVTLYSPPCTKQVDRKEDVGGKSNDRELPPEPILMNTKAPPSDPVLPSTEPEEEKKEIPVETKLNIKRDVEALDQQLAALADLGKEPVELQQPGDNTVESLEQQLADLAEKLSEVKKMSSFDSSSKATKTPSETLADTAESKPKEGAPQLAKTSSPQCPTNIEDQAKASDEDEDEIPCMDEIIASRELYSSDEEEDRKNGSITEESEQRSEGTSEAENEAEKKKELEQSSPSDYRDQSQTKSGDCTAAEVEAENEAETKKELEQSSPSDDQDQPQTKSGDCTVAEAEAEDEAEKKKELEQTNPSDDQDQSEAKPSDCTVAEVKEEEAEKQEEADP